MSVGGSIVFMNIFCEAKCMKFFYGIPNQALLDWLPNTFLGKKCMSVRYFIVFMNIFCEAKCMKFFCGILK